MRTSANVTRHSVVVGVSISYAIATTAVTGLIPSSRELYAADNPHLNLQAAALLKGSLSLGLSPGAMAFDLAWAEGGVQQVWGLGVPLWLGFLSKVLLFGDAAGFPSRIGFAALLAIVALTVLEVGCSLARGLFSGNAERNAKLSLVLIPASGLVLLFPPFFVLLASGFDVYEEVVAYGQLVAVLIGATLVSVLIMPTPGKLLLLGFLCGAAGHIRPTIALYAVIAMGIVVHHLRRKCAHRIWLWCSCVLFLAGTVLLMLGNRARFGSPIEFGHSLNVSYHHSCVYSTKFGSPFSRTPTVAAAKELMGALCFDGSPNDGNWLAHGVFRWQADELRWRECYLPAVGWMRVFPLLGGLPVLVCLGGHWRHAVPIRGLALYAGGSFVALFAFYLYTPVMSSRYLHDFCASVSLGLTSVWIAIWVSYQERHPRQPVGWRALVAVICLVVLMKPASSPFDDRRVSCSRTEFLDLIDRFRARSVSDVEAPGGGAIFDPWERRIVGLSAIPFDGFGWSARDGRVSVVTTHFARDVRHLTLRVKALSPLAEVDWIRVKVGLEELRREHIDWAPDGTVRIRFAEPRRKAYGRGIQPVFIAWVARELMSSSGQYWQLIELAWHEPGEAEADNQGFARGGRVGASPEASYPSFPHAQPDTQSAMRSGSPGFVEVSRNPAADWFSASFANGPR